MTDLAKIERELKRLDHYKTRFIEHQRAIEFSKKQKSLILEQIATAIDVNPSFSPMDFQFLVDIAQLIIVVRRSLSYTYAIRFYLTGQNKQSFFDFIQAELESSLERLNKLMETEKWIDKLDYDESGRVVEGERFFTFKARVTDLTKTLQGHFNKMMQDIMSGLSDVKEVDDTKDDFTFDGTNTGHWTCRTCQIKNPQQNAACSYCKSPKPQLNYAATVSQNRTQNRAAAGAKNNTRVNRR